MRKSQIRIFLVFVEILLKPLFFFFLLLSSISGILQMIIVSFFLSTIRGLRMKSLKRGRGGGEFAVLPPLTARALSCGCFEG